MSKKKDARALWASERKRILKFLAADRDEFYTSPTWREISLATGTPKDRLRWHMHRLRDKGFVTFEDNVCRSTRLVKPDGD